MHNSGNSILKIGGLLVALLLFVTGTALGADRIDGSYARDRVLVKFHETPQGAALSAFGRNHKLLLRRVIPRIAVHRFSISDGQSLSDVIEKLSADPRVAFAEPDYIRWPTYTPNDPLFPLQWDMTLMALPSVWDFGIGSSNVVTAVVDTGIELAHPDLVNQLWLNSDEIPGNGFDDDFNGYVDDVVGYDFAGNGWFPGPGAEDPVPNDDFVGEGPHAAGTIGA